MHGSVIKTTIQTHANTRASPMPTDTARALIAAARAKATFLGEPPSETLTVCIKNARTGVKISQCIVYPTLPELQAEASGVPALSAKQKKILAALLAGPMKGDALADEIGVGGRSSLSAGKRGIRELMNCHPPMVENDRDDGYRLTEFGEDVATEIAEG